MTRSILRFAACVTLLAGLAGCAVNAATGRRQLNLIGQDQEISLGAQAAPQFLKGYGGEVPSAPLVQYVRGIGQRLAAVSERPALPWEFHVVDSPVINAFALPGGKIFITRGLLAKLESEAEVAGVLGHEVGHVTAEHIGQQMTQQIGISVGLELLGVVAQTSDNDWLNVLGAGAQVGGGLYMLSFGRGHEIEADELGVRYMAKLGYNPVAQIKVMETLKREAGSGGSPEFLSTHPHPETRIQNLQEHIAKTYPRASDPTAYRVGADDYRANVLNVLARLPAPTHKPDVEARQNALRARGVR